MAGTSSFAATGLKNDLSMQRHLTCKINENLSSQYRDERRTHAVPLCFPQSRALGRRPSSSRPGNGGRFRIAYSPATRRMPGRADFRSRLRDDFRSLWRSGLHRTRIRCAPCRPTRSHRRRYCRDYATVAPAPSIQRPQVRCACSRTALTRRHRTAAPFEPRNKRGTNRAPPAMRMPRPVAAPRRDLLQTTRHYIEHPFCCQGSEPWATSPTRNACVPPRRGYPDKSPSVFDAMMKSFGEVP